MPVVDPLPTRPDDPRLLLAYGTLKEDEPIHGGAAVPRVITVRRGLRIPGRLYDVGAYPAAVLDHAALRGARPVTTAFVADLVRIVTASTSEEELEATLAAYDDYEDEEYRRIAIPLDDPAHTGAWIYEWVSPTTGLAPIPSGEWSLRHPPRDD